VKKRVYISIIASITVCAFFLRLIIAFELYKSDPAVIHPSQYSDMFTYMKYAKEILSGEYKGLFYYQPFYYTVFLPIILILSAKSIAGVLLVQVLLSALTVYLSAITAGELFGKKSGIAAGLLTCFSTMLMLYVPYMLIATLQSFWVILICYYSLKSIRGAIDKIKETRQITNWLILGIICGAAILTRGNIWFFIPGIIAVITILSINFRKKYPKIKQFLPIVVFIAGVFIPQLPFIYHNTKILGHLSGPSTAADAVLSIGNTPQSPPGGRETGTGAGPMEYSETCNYWTKTSKEKPAFRRIINWFSEEPAAFLEFQFRKLLLFWSADEIPNNISLEDNGLKSRIFTFINLLAVEKAPTGRLQVKNNFIPLSLLLLILGVSGLFLYTSKLFIPFNINSFTLNRLYNKLKAHPQIYLLLYFVISYSIATAAFYNLARFRVPLLPVIAVFAGSFIQFIVNNIKLRNKKKIIISLIITVCAIFTVLYAYNFYRYFLEKKIMKIVRPNGTVSYLKNKIAIEDYGPFTFGSWSLIPFTTTTVFQKNFILQNNLKKSDEYSISIPVVWKNPGKAEITINRTKQTIMSQKAGKQIYKFPVDNPKKITIKLISSNQQIFLIGDYQRNYERTFKNGTEQKFELVIELYIEEKK